MALVVTGRIVPISNDLTAAPDDQASVSGKVWIGDDGRITALTRGRAAGPPTLAGAPVVDVGRRPVVPAPIDRYNHLAYDTYAHLPPGGGFCLPVRPAVRSGVADGAPIEDLGIFGTPDAITRRDLLDGSGDLLVLCAGLLPAPAVPTAAPAAPLEENR